jgi:hypothetical protein
MDVNKKNICIHCHKEHLCKRCIKNMHICFDCGGLIHQCDICGTLLNSLSTLKKHQRESKMCKKIKSLTVNSFEEQILRSGLKIIKQPRTKSTPKIMTVEANV